MLTGDNCVYRDYILDAVGDLDVAVIYGVDLINTTSIRLVY